jgi:hypothetical protein
VTSVDCDDWATALWRHFSPDIRTGLPFYLAADRGVVTTVYRAIGHTSGTTDDALRSFHSACAALLDASGSRTLVRARALERVAGQPHSRAICLAVQQVLVVEDMLRDSEYSEQAYFPRYRQALGLAEGGEHSSPISTKSFAEIWSVLATELAGLPGASSRTVTFTAGRGRDVNRHFPLSQALLTTHDLMFVRAKNPELQQETNDRTIVAKLLGHRAQFGLRAWRLVRTAASSVPLASRLGEQIRSFIAAGLERPLATEEAEAVERAWIVAYLTAADWFDLESADTYSIYRRTETEQSVGDLLERTLRVRLRDAFAIYLVPDADGFREWSKNAQLDVSDAALAVVLAERSERFLNHVLQETGIAFARVGSNLPGAFDVLISHGGLAPFLDGLAGPERRQGPGVEFVGGVLADARSRTYLAGYSPVGIRCGGRLLGAHEAILIDGVERIIGEWLRSLDTEEARRSYSIELEGHVLQLSIAARRQRATPEQPVGYILRIGELDVAASHAAHGQPRLSGAAFVEVGNRGATLDRQDLLALTTRGRRLALSSQELSQLVAHLQALEFEDVMARLALRQVMATRSIPLGAAIRGLHRRVTN